MKHQEQEDAEAKDRGPRNQIRRRRMLMMRRGWRGRGEDIGDERRPRRGAQQKWIAIVIDADLIRGHRPRLQIDPDDLPIIVDVEFIGVDHVRSGGRSCPWVPSAAARLSRSQRAC